MPQYPPSVTTAEQQSPTRIPGQPTQPITATDQHRNDPPQPGGTTLSTAHAPAHPPTPTGDQFIEMQQSPQFQELRSRLLRFVLPISAFFLIWYAVYVLLGAFAHDFMATKVIGEINLGVILGLLQFVTTFVITWAYVRFANRELDPRAEAIRNQMEAEAPKA